MYNSVSVPSPPCVITHRFSPLQESKTVYVDERFLMKKKHQLHECMAHKPRLKIWANVMSKGGVIFTTSKPSWSGILIHTQRQ